MNSTTGIHIKNTGIVYKKTIGNYAVQVDGRVVNCAISTRLRKDLVYPTADPHSLSHIVRDVKKIGAIDPVAVGDEVVFVDAQDGSGLIVEILPRRTRLVRKSAVPMPGAHPFEQIIVANLDQVVPIFSVAQPAPHWNLLDRYLASAESLELASLIVITKMDLAYDSQGEADEQLKADLDSYREIGYQVLTTSVVTGEGIEQLKGALKDRVSVFMGKSGVGKSSLLNAIEPGLGLRVNDVNRVTGKGKHTTTHLEMFPLDMGGAVVDTPGMREFGLWDVDESDLALLFPEMRPYVGRCKFGLDCTHDHEPGCAIRKAVMQGKISERRYQSYLRLYDEE